MLYGIVFLSGAILMAVEMTGSRVLAPAFGNSIYVWGALITVVMAALTLGYYLGGKVADRHPHLAVMGIILFLAGCAVGFLPFWVTTANHYLSDFDPRFGSLAAATIYFFIPAVLLAMISPYGIKLSSHNLTTLGHTAGRLTALSSAGSIIGTLATSFFLIPAMGVRAILHMLGVILMLLAVLTFWYQHRQSFGRARKILLMVLAMAMVGLVGLGGSWLLSGRNGTLGDGSGERILYERDTLYHHVAVRQYHNLRYLHFDNSYQSGIDLDAPLEMVFEYTSYLHLGVVAKPQPKQALFIGLGGGSAPVRFLHDYPTLRQIDVVEIDPEVIRVAYRYFEVPQDPRLKVAAQDGRLFVKQKYREIQDGLSQPYDLVVIDAYNSDAIPYHLTTLEFLSAVQSVLSKDGVLVSNIIGAVDGPESRLLRAMTRTFKQLFPEVYLFPVNGWSGPDDIYQRNIITIATLDPVRRDRAFWQRRAEMLMASGIITENVVDYAKMLVDDTRIMSADYFRDVPVLTDDYAPVDILQHIQR